MAALGLLIIAALVVAFMLYRFILAPNTRTPHNQTFFLFIPTTATYQDVVDSLDKHDILVSTFSFNWLAEKKEYPALVKPGRYTVENAMSNLRLVNMLRAGEQSPVKITFNNIRTVDQLAGVISKQIEADSATISTLLHDQSYLAKYGLDMYTAPSLFIPNTYEFYWNTSAEQFLERMYAEYQKFWDAPRRERLIHTGLNIPEVVTLASIVEKETNKNDEKARIAGVYMNRLNKGWPLQADPTLVFATGDFSATRVLNEHKKVDSPYNTYKFKGLPPGPICIPSIASVDAVLNYEKHDYMYFVARSDLSGYHVFSKTLMEHNKHARNYRKAVTEARKNS